MYRLFDIDGFTAMAQDGNVHQTSESEKYVWPTDPQVLEKLDNWRDLKFGVLFHWGLYSVPGICESWGLCSEDVEWLTHDTNYEEHKKWYFGLKDQFNPVDFNPEQWAAVMKEAGMKYMIFTMKHHDGFCMYDTKYTDFSVASTPFGGHPKMDVANYIFNAFRNQGLMTGAYFSKPDWHCEWYWSPNLATPDRHHNYKISLHPQWWKNYQTFTDNQLDEILDNYGPFDILWLDGGWVTGDEINLDAVLEKGRVKNPGLLSVDRTIGGKNENYLTPEGTIPPCQLDCPWESCIPLSYNWGWIRSTKAFKTPRKIINTLIEICAKGGCFALGIGPTPQGIIQPEVVDILQKVGKWLDANGKAIYKTRNAEHYHDGSVWFTADKDGQTLYAIYALPEKEKLPEMIAWSGNLPAGKMSLVSNGRRVSYTCKDGKVIVRLPAGLQNEPFALQFKIKK